MIESFNERGIYITDDNNTSHFGLLSLILNPRLSRGVFSENLDDC